MTAPMEVDAGLQTALIDGAGGVPLDGWQVAEDPGGDHLFPA